MGKQCMFVLVCCLTILAHVRTDVRHLLLMTQGGEHNFSSLWDLQTPLNDPHGNRSVDNSLASSDFRVLPDPAWGSPTVVIFEFVNSFDDTLCMFGFDVGGQNITELGTWLVPQNLLHSYPQMGDFNISESVGPHEIVISKVATDSILMAIVHGNTPDPLLLLPVNQTDYVYVTSGGSPSDEGCLVYYDLNTTHMFMDAVNLTTGNSCNCATIHVIQVHGDLPAHCTLPCPGDNSQLCGGTSGYYSVYSVPPQSAQSSTTLDSLPNNSSGDVLLTTSENNWPANVLLNVSTPDDPLYVSKLSVNARTTSDVPTNFTFEYREEVNSSEYRMFDDGLTQMVSDGAWIDVDILLLSDFRLAFIEDVSNVTVQLYGPVEYVAAPYLRVFAEFEQTTSTSTTTSTTTSATTLAPTSTTTPASTSTSTPAPTSTSTSAPTSPTTTSTQQIITVPYTLYSNNSILFNGTMYCPCNGITNATTTNTNVTANTSYDIDVLVAEMTLDVNTLSSNTRKYTSAEDSRPSAKTIGSVGIIILVVSLGSIVLLDSTNLAIEAAKIKKNYRYLKKQLSKRSLRVGDISTETSVTSLSNECHDIPDDLK